MTDQGNAAGGSPLPPPPGSPLPPPPPSPPPLPPPPAATTPEGDGKASRWGRGRRKQSSEPTEATDAAAVSMPPPAPGVSALSDPSAEEPDEGNEDDDEVEIDRSHGGLNRTIPRKVAKFLAKQGGGLFENEPIEAVVGNASQVLICTDRRLLVVKVGVMAASTGGGRLTAFPIEDVTAVQKQLGLSMGTLSVQSPAYGATQTGDYWASGKDDWRKLPNVIIWSKQLDRQFTGELAHIHHRIAEARQARHAPPPAPATAAVTTADTATQLERMAALHRDGMLTDDEFAAAKRQLLGLD